MLLLLNQKPCSKPFLFFTEMDLEQKQLEEAKVKKSQSNSHSSDSNKVIKVEPGNEINLVTNDNCSKIVVDQNQNPQDNPPSFTESEHVSSRTSDGSTGSASRNPTKP